MGQNLQSIRESQQMTQEELAAKSGVSRATISGLENGYDRYPSTKTVIKLANALGVTAQSIYNGLN